MPAAAFREQVGLGAGDGSRREFDKRTSGAKGIGAPTASGPIDRPGVAPLHTAAESL